MTAPALVAKAIEEQIAKREQRIIAATLSKITAEGFLEPEFAIQQWVALNEARKLMTALNHEAQAVQKRKATLDTIS